MVRQTRSKKAENLGKGKVTPVQVAFIVDRYLSDNKFTQSRSAFREEASSLISKTSFNEAPKSLLSLDAILDEYICLKEQKVLLEQERVQVELEKSRVEALLKGMQCVMEAYNNSTPMISSPLQGSSSMDLVPQSNPSLGTPSGNATNVTPASKSVPWLQNTAMGHTNSPAPRSNLPSQNKRKGSKPLPDGPTSTKRQCSRVTRKTSTAGTKLPLQAHNTNSIREMPEPMVSSVQSSSRTSSAVSSSTVDLRVQESSVAKSLFKQCSPPLQSSSPSPKTPPQECTSHVDNPASPLDNSSHVNSTCITTPQDITSNCAVISSVKTVTVSPSKHLGCYQVERSHYVSSSSPAKGHLKRLGARDHVKGRLDFGSDMPTSSDQTATVDISTSGSDDNMFDMDLSNFDLFNPDFPLSDFLDIDLDCGDVMDSANNILEGSTDDSGVGNLDANYSYSELLSTVTETLSERDMNIQGHDSSALLKTVTKCITITSPVKKQRSSAMDQENLVAIN